MAVLRGLRRPKVALLHIALVVIALGAVATWAFGEEGEIEVCPISFEAPTYQGSEAARDYRATVDFSGDTVEISVNHAAKVGGTVYTLHSYTPEAEVVTLKWRRDPWGEPMVFAGYALALIALAWGWLRKARAILLMLAFLLAPVAQAGEFDDALRGLPVYWGERVTTVEVMARDMKVNGEGKALFNRMMYSSEALRIFPIEGRWYSPVSRELPADMASDEWLFVRKSLGLVNECLIRGDEGRAAEILGKIERYQRKSRVDMPSRARLDVERWYRRLAGLFWSRCGGTASHRVSSALGILLLLYQTGMLGARWWLSGHVPLSNGFETMEVAAWVALLMAFVARERVMKAVGALAAGLFMLVGSMSGASIAVEQLMPVLNSPWLSLHVSVIMISYTLFLVMGIMGALGRNTRRLLPVAVSLLALGIIVGSVWASESWGRYWGWDPKETWALITLVIYCVPLHPSLVPALRLPRVYNIYMVVALVAVAVTYFGANYLLPGLHSYA
ncbi:MAG: cytochrome c biogenesis protein CcsA [Bacteroidales bacterium]|nr:cytochrome c biogenesis protein CcsA [Bacteroidales bacterium]